MSEFKQTVLEAKNKEHKKRLYYALGIAMAGFVVIIFLLLSRGTLIEVLPADIKKYAKITSASSFSFIINGHLYSLVSETAVNAQAEGYKPKTQTLTQADFGKVTTVTLDPLPSQLVLTSDAGDDETRWSIDGNLVAVEKTLDKNLEAGDYKIDVSHPYFEQVNVSYSLKPGKTIKQTVVLTPLEGAIEVKSRPEGAVVSINGEVRGETPMQLSLQGGRFDIVVTKPGYDAIEDEVEVKTNALTPSRDYRLALKSAGIVVSVFPTGGALTLNGINVKAAAKIKVKAGKKTTLRYKKPGYFTQSKSFTLGPDEVKRYDFNLEKEMGRVEVTSNTSAEVYINGQKVGETPFEIALNAIEHTVEVRSSGYRSAYRTIKPKADSVTLFKAKLATEKQARLAESPPAYKTKTGEMMVLFKVNDSVDMGAERSEAGQRANEFVRTARINKPFYAGRYEVTNAAYAKYKTSHSGPAGEPVSNVSWFDAVRYANWLSAAEGRQVVYELSGNRLLRVNSTADGYRLLTEAEWEWIARKAGRNNESLFAWGNAKTLPRKAANIADESVKGTVPLFVPRYNDSFSAKASVGSMAKEKSALFDMAGNVSEWTHDSYDLTPPSKGVVEAHELDLSLTKTRVVKGANWRSGSLTELRASYREGMEQPSAVVGFRLGRFLYGGN
jgi:formylglycine-generating enzyme required for sulfatase activity